MKSYIVTFEVLSDFLVQSSFASLSAKSTQKKGMNVTIYDRSIVKSKCLQRIETDRSRLLITQNTTSRPAAWHFELLRLLSDDEFLLVPNIDCFWHICTKIPSL